MKTSCVILRVLLALLVPAVGATSSRYSQSSVDDQEYWVEELTRGLKFPSAIDWLPDGRALITERHGGVHVLTRAGTAIHPLETSLANYVHSDYYNGVADIAVDPDFSINSFLYFSLTEGTYDNHHAAIYRARLDMDRLLDIRRMFRAKDDLAAVGNASARLLFMPDKTILVAVPENNYYKARAQRLDSHVGKVLRINRDGAAPTDNPFANVSGALPEIWSYGHRVQTGLFLDQSTGRVWEVEPGPKGGDELNVLMPGANYGWADVSWGFDYEGGMAAPQQSSLGVTDPVLVWMRAPRSTPAGLTRYMGKMLPRWRGDFFVGHLAGKRLERIRVRSDKVVLQETMLENLDERIRDVKAGPDGYIYVLTDHERGRVMRLRPGTPTASQVRSVATRLNQDNLFVKETSNAPAGNVADGKEAFLQRCSGCHVLGQLIPGGAQGPDLEGVQGRKAGSLPGFNYSREMAQLPQVWDRISLEIFIANPERYVPGTTMATVPIEDPVMRKSIVEFLTTAAAKK